MFLTLFYEVMLILIKIILLVEQEIVERHWDIRKTYQTCIYRFNSYHEYNLLKRKIFIFYNKVEYSRLFMFTYIEYFNFIKIFRVNIRLTLLFHWYYTCWIIWCCLTIYVYYHYKLRDLGPSYDIYDYNPEDNMGIYKTAGPWILVSFFFWTISANTAFMSSVNFFFNKFFIKRYTWNYWYKLTTHSFIKMHISAIFNSYFNTNYFLITNFNLLTDAHNSHHLFKNSSRLLNFYNFVKISELKTNFLWFPWESFYNYITIISVMYILTFLSIYNTENSYYLVVYLIFVIFLFASTLIMFDLDIFAGLLLLIESVVILMLFFLIIYITPNIQINSKVNSWKIWILSIIMISLLSLYSYCTLGPSHYPLFSNVYELHDDFYDALYDLIATDLTGVYINLYATNSLLMVVIGLLLLIASIICVILVSFFTKLRAFNYNTFFQFFEIAKIVIHLFF